MIFLGYLSCSSICRYLLYCSISSLVVFLYAVFVFSNASRNSWRMSPLSSSLVFCNTIPFLILCNFVVACINHSYDSSYFFYRIPCLSIIGYSFLHIFSKCTQTPLCNMVDEVFCCICRYLLYCSISSLVVFLYAVFCIF